MNGMLIRSLDRGATIFLIIVADALFTVVYSRIGF